MSSILLLHAESEAKITHEHVRNELVRISNRIGRGFLSFLGEREGNLYFDAAEGTLNPNKWKFIPPYGTDGDIADSPAGFALFFLTATGMPFAGPQIEWADFCWDCFRSKVGAIIEASRGFGKSIFMRCLLAYLIGLYPDKSSIIVRSADGPARKTAEGIAKLISDNPAWKLWFPGVEPKARPGQAGGEWSAQAGYSVIDLSRPAEEWATVETARTSPTLSKFGLGSKSAIGSRATLAMLADDIHDADNSDSPGQLADTITKFQEHLEPARTPESRLAIIGTPWGREDLLQILPVTGEYRKLKTPITLEGTYPGTPAWPEMFDAAAIDRIFNSDTTPNKRGFKRNRLLNLEAEIERHFKYSFYPHRKIESHWAVRMGVDYASLDAGDSVTGRSYFAIVVTTQEPISGSWVVIDGYVGHVTQSQAERVVIDLYNKYGRKPRVEVICVETVGSGKEFERYLSRLPLGMPLIGETGGGVQKEVRWENTLEPALAGERILISDQENHPFLKSLITALNSYPNISKRGDPSADILDAMVWGHFHAFLAYGDPVRRRKKAEPQPNPFYQLVGLK